MHKPRGVHITQELLSAKISSKIRKNVYKKGHYSRALCDSEWAIQIHHVMPRSLGSTDTEKNLITLCMYCHGELHGTHFSERPDWMDAKYAAMIEYMADYYAGNSDPCWPFL